MMNVGAVENTFYVNVFILLFVIRGNEGNNRTFLTHVIRKR